MSFELLEFLKARSSKFKANVYLHLKLEAKSSKLTTREDFEMKIIGKILVFMVVVVWAFGLEIEGWINYAKRKKQNKERTEEYLNQFAAFRRIDRMRQLKGEKNESERKKENVGMD